MEIRTYRIRQQEYTAESTARPLRDPAALQPERARRTRRRLRGRRRVITMRGYAVFFVAACLMTMLLLNQYLMLQSSVRRRTRAVSVLRTRLEDARRENDDLEESIDSSVNLAYVYDYAVRELGLVPLKASQVMTFDRKNQEYVLQQEDIPRF